MRRIWTGAGLNGLVFVATVAVGFGLTPRLIQSLGKPDYDIWCFVEAVLAYFTLLDLGLAATVVRVVARAQVHRPAAERQPSPAPSGEPSQPEPVLPEVGLQSLRTLRAAAAIFSLGSLVVLLLGGTLLAYWGPALSHRASDPSAVPGFLALMLLQLALLLPLSLFPAILDGLEAFTPKALIRLVTLVIRTVGLLLSLQAGGGLLMVGGILVLTTTLEHLALAGCAYRYWPGLSVAPWRAERAALREALSLSAYAFVAMLSGRITWQTGAILVGLWLPEGRLTDWALALRLSEYAKQLLRQFTTTLTPGISAAQARQDEASIQRTFTRGSQLLLWMSWPIQLGLWWWGSRFLAAWVGPAQAEASAAALQILALPLALALLQSVAARVLYGLGELRAFAGLTLLEGLANLGLTCLLLPQWGLVGVAWAVAGPNLLANVVVIGMVLRRLKLPVGGYLVRGTGPLLASLPMVALWWLWDGSTYTPGEGFLGILAGGLLGLVPYAILGWLCERGWANVPRRPRWNLPGMTLKGLDKS